MMYCRVVSSMWLRWHYVSQSVWLVLRKVRPSDWCVRLQLQQFGWLCGRGGQHLTMVNWEWSMVHMDVVLWNGINGTLELTQLALYIIYIYVYKSSCSIYIYVYEMYVGIYNVRIYCVSKKINHVLHHVPHRWITYMIYQDILAHVVVVGLVSTVDIWRLCTCGM